MVGLPKGKYTIGTRWLYRNKQDGRGIINRNKARLIAQAYTQEKLIDYEEVFAPVARTEVIRMFLDYCAHMNFTRYQMDMKCAFLYAVIDEEVYVQQPPSFEDSFFHRVIKLDKTLYGLHQAPRKWYKTLSSYLMENGFKRGRIDQTPFLKKQDIYLLLVQIYVDDIIFGSTNRDMCKDFDKLMQSKFHIS